MRNEILSLTNEKSTTPLSPKNTLDPEGLLNVDLLTHKKLTDRAINNLNNQLKLLNNVIKYFFYLKSVGNL